MICPVLKYSVNDENLGFPFIRLSVLKHPTPEEAQKFVIRRVALSNYDFKKNAVSLQIRLSFINQTNPQTLGTYQN